MTLFKFGGVIGRSQFQKPATLMYPIRPRIWTPATRGHVVLDPETCILCGSCQRKCPATAIEIDKTARTWSINRMSCVQCGYCVEICPKQSLRMDPQYTAPDTRKDTDTLTVPAKPKSAAAD